PPAAPGGPPPPPPPGTGTAPDAWPEGPFNLPLAERVAMYDGVLALVRQALPMECLIPPPASPVEFPAYLAEFRSLARRFIMEAGQRRATGDYRGAADSALDALEMAQDVKTQQTMIAHLVGMACEAIAFASLDATVPGLTSAECQEVLARLRGRLASRPSQVDLVWGAEIGARAHLKYLLEHPNWMSERYMKVEPKLSAEEIKHRQDELPDAWNRMGRCFDELRAGAALPYTKQPIRTAQGKNVYLMGLTDSLTRTLLKETQATTIVHLHELQLAAQAYILDKGRPPSDDLSELVPGYIEQIPEDPMTGEPLKGAVRGFILYSVGPDGVDNKGRAFDITVEVGSGTNRNP
ncbi:MAG: hypothetical protein KKI08_01145, partial [Armatimonadetes bacterium]|nr:hypothetical protein [Armatimonadota bacterium]